MSEPQPPQPDANSRAAAEQLARIALASTERSQRRQLIAHLARTVCETAAADPEPAACAAAWRALAIEVCALPASGAEQQLADLRLFARLTLRECADLTRTQHDELVARWSALRPTLFRRARRRLGRPPEPPPQAAPTEV